MKKIYIVAPNIKNGGGKELLEYLLEYLALKYHNLSVQAYLDHSLKGIKTADNIEVEFFSGFWSKVKLFTRKLDRSLYFGNLPPIQKSTHSVVYFHNLYLLMSARKLLSTSLKFLCKYSLQQIYISNFIKNVDVLACQTQLVKTKFVEKFNFRNVEILPFFRLSQPTNTVFQKKKYDFCYVSLAHPHKNHLLLFEALQLLSDEGVKVSIAVTIEPDKLELLKEIDEINSYGVVKIDNLGLVPKGEVANLYVESVSLVFPSKEESFGLPLIEAVEMGVDVVAADLDYVYQVVEPSLVFDPNSAESCAEAMKEYLNGSPKKSVGLIENEIEKLIKIVLAD